jgi:hypothetical protein
MDNVSRESGSLSEDPWSNEWMAVATSFSRKMLGIEVGCGGGECEEGTPDYMCCVAVSKCRVVPSLWLRPGPTLSNSLALTHAHGTRSDEPQRGKAETFAGARAQSLGARVESSFLLVWEEVVG